MAELEPRCAAFLEHWKSLRFGKLVPTVEDFLDHPSLAHAPLLFMAEIVGGKFIPRLQGTGLVERWNHDLTARKMHEDRSEGYLKELIDNYLAVMRHPCGCYLLNEYANAKGGVSRLRVIYLPLTSKPGREPRIVGYSCELEPRIADQHLALADRLATMEACWIDIGAGVPAYVPHLPGG